MAKEWRTRRLSRRYVLILASILALLAFAATASGNLTGSTFDGGDGNLVVNDEAKDWANIGIVCETAGCAIDEPTGSSDDSFGEGTSENDDPPSVVDGSIPNNKSDLTRFYVANEKAGSPAKDFLYLAWERVQEPSGTTNMDFEFNKGSTLSSNGVTPTREQGDLLIKYDLSQGGTNPTLGFHRWQTQAANPSATTASARGAICEAGNKFPCWGKVQSLAGNFEGAVNTATVIDPINPDAPRSLSARTFGEAAINLTDSGLFPAGQCTSFGSGYLKSRSSDSFTAAIKDFIAPIPINISNCGTIIITKDAVPEDGTDFSFTDNIPAPCAIGPLDDDSDATLSNTVTCTSVQAGTYTVTEDGETGWSLTDITCTDPSGGTSDTGATATIGLAADETVSCTFTNRKQATVTVIKDATPEDGTNFAFGQTGLGTPDSFTLDDDANDSGDGTGGDFADRKTYTLPGSSFSSGSVSASVSETLLNGWDLTGRSCTGTTASNSGNNGLSFTVQSGDSIVCTFTNIKQATVRVIKVATPQDGTDFAFAQTGLGSPASFTLDDDANDSGDGTGGNFADRKDYTLGGSSFASGNVSATVTETIPSAWSLTGRDCTGVTESQITGGVSFTVAPGDAIVCTFTNVKDATVTIVKDAVPNADTDFTFAVTGAGWGLASFLLDDDSNATLPSSRTFTFAAADLGSKTVTETPIPAGWSFGTLVCSEGTIVGAQATLSVDAGDAITCTYTNNSKHVVIVVVCHQGTAKLFPSTVQIDPVSGAQKTTIAAAALPSSIGESDLCGLGGARFEDLNHITDRPFDVTIPSAGH